MKEQKFVHKTEQVNTRAWGNADLDGDQSPVLGRPGDELIMVASSVPFLIHFIGLVTASISKEIARQVAKNRFKERLRDYFK